MCTLLILTIILFLILDSNNCSFLKFIFGVLLFSLIKAKVGCLTAIIIVIVILCLL